MLDYNLGLQFNKIVKRLPNKTALILPSGESFSYRELDSFSTQIAHYLQSKGLREKDVVCISGEKDLESFACLIACLKLGIIYSFFDPDSPEERIKHILNVCEAKLIITKHSTQLMNDSFSKRVIEKEKLFPQSKKCSQRGPIESNSISGMHPAYIMFTSGSTGIPKGVLISHLNLLNFIQWSKDTYQINPQDVLSNLNPLYFDNSVFDIYASFFNGATLLAFPHPILNNIEKIAQLVDDFCCTIWFSVPSLLLYLQTIKAFHSQNMSSIKKIIFGGEGYPKEKLEQLFHLYSKRTKFYNVYGPTECTCICSSYQIKASDFLNDYPLVPLGTVSRDFTYVILDEENRKVSEGSTGELCLMGANLGLGYYNNQEESLKRFVKNPLNNQFPERMYRTGDLVKKDLQDGRLYIMGRKDNQIKHMGYRIELEEIDAAINRLPYVNQAVTLYKKTAIAGKIIAVIALNRSKGEIQIRNDLKRMIPKYMVPEVFYFEKELKKNPNGKVDRKILAETHGK